MSPASTHDCPGYSCARCNPRGQFDPNVDRFNRVTMGPYGYEFPAGRVHYEAIPRGDGTSEYVTTYDPVAGPWPGTVWWPRAMGEVPAGWRIVASAWWMKEVFIARRRYALPLRTMVWLGDMRRWIAQGIEGLRLHWQFRPRFRIRVTR